MVTVTSSAGPSRAKPKKTRRSKKKRGDSTQGAPQLRGESDEDGQMQEDLLPTDTANAASRPTSRAPANTNEDDDDDDVVMIDPSAAEALSAPLFPPLPASAQVTAIKSETRRIAIPPHRMTPLKKEWINIFSPLTEMCGLQVRMNVHRRSLEMRTSKHTKDIGALQRGADFVKAFALGFEVNDALALLRIDDIYLDSFEIKDVKTLQGDHLARAIGRIAGHGGKTKFTIENTSRTRIVLADTKIHILGSFQNIKIARDAIVSLILGSPPGKVYANLRTVGARMKQRAL